MLAMFSRSKHALCWSSFRVYLSPNLPYPSDPQQQPETSRVTKAFPQTTKSSFPSCPGILSVCFFDKEFYAATNLFQWPFSCLGHCSCQCLTHKLPAPEQAAGSSDTAAEGSTLSNASCIIWKHEQCCRFYESLQKTKGKEADRADVIPDSCNLPWTRRPTAELLTQQPGNLWHTAWPFQMK